MYTRAYYPEEEKISVPENYDGTALREHSDTAEAKAPEREEIPLRAPWDVPKAEAEEEKEASEAVMSQPRQEGFLGGILKKLPIKSLFGGLDVFSADTFKLGSEEILIIGVALFLLFSKGGDRECAIMLLLLLLIK